MPHPTSERVHLPASEVWPAHAVDVRLDKHGGGHCARGPLDKIKQNHGEGILLHTKDVLQVGGAHTAVREDGREGRSLEERRRVWIGGRRLPRGRALHVRAEPVNVHVRANLRLLATVRGGPESACRR